MDREPDRFIPPGIPRILLSESDFHDPDRRDGGRCTVSCLLSVCLHLLSGTIHACQLLLLNGV